jgi:peptidoglycan/xylan/chitin deacetylase (PgdA/CDA1 family)
MLLLVAAVSAAVLVLAHTAPFPFLLEGIRRGDSLWHAPAAPVAPSVYLTFDDGPNPTATPALLDTLARHGVHATFFVIDKHLTRDTAPIVRRAFEDGHAVALHSHTRTLMFKTPDGLATTLQRAAERMEQLTGHLPCRAFRPHAGNRSVPMLIGAARAGYRIIGWGWMLWDFNWLRAKTADALVPRLVDRASPGDIVVIHDGHHEDPRSDRRYAVETVDQLIPALRVRGFEFGTICP